MTGPETGRPPPLRLPALPGALLEPPVRRALAEDLGEAGDITSAALLPPDLPARATLASRQAGTVAGLAAALLAFRCTDPELVLRPLRQDGDRVAAGEALLQVQGSAVSILAAERTALNFARHLSGVATAARRMVDAIAHTPARLLCTRKTTPGLRALEKHAVRAGGGCSHRFGLHDGYLIKDNHVAALGGDVAAAVRRARRAAGPMRVVELEVDTLAQLEAVLAGDRPDMVLLDNMHPGELSEAVRRVAGRFLLEASGRLDPDSAAAVAETGVDYLSSGWVTHSAPALDLGLDFA